MNGRYNQNKLFDESKHNTSSSTGHSPNKDHQSSTLPTKNSGYYSTTLPKLSQNKQRESNLETSPQTAPGSPAKNLINSSESPESPSFHDFYKIDDHSLNFEELMARTSQPKLNLSSKMSSNSPNKNSNNNCDLEISSSSPTTVTTCTKTYTPNSNHHHSNKLQHTPNPLNPLLEIKKVKSSLRSVSHTTDSPGKKRTELEENLLKLMNGCHTTHFS